MCILLAFYTILIVGVCILLNFVEVAANMYSEMREEARDHARVRNVYFEQVWLACLYLKGTR